MKLRIPFLLLSILFGTFSSKANPIDSLHQILLKYPTPSSKRAEVLLELAESFGTVDRDSMINYYRKALSVGLQLDDQVIQLKSHERLAWGLLEQRLQMDSAAMHLHEGLELARAQTDQAYLEASLLRTQGEYYRQTGALEAGLESLEKASQILEEGLAGKLSANERALYDAKYILVLNAQGNILKNQGNCKDAIQIHERILELARQTDNYNQMSFATFNIGSCYFMLGDFPRALDNYLKSPTYTKDPAIKQNMVANISMAVGAVFGEMGQLDSAKVYFKKALETGSNSQRARTRMGAFENLGVLEMLQERYDSAIYYFEQSMTLARTSNRKGMLASSLNQLGTAHLYSDHLTEASTYLSEAYQLARELGNPSELAYINAALAEYHLKIGNAQRAINFATEALTAAETMQLADIVRRSTLSLSKAYEARGDSRQALAYFHQHVALKDSMRNEDKVREITQLKMQNEFEQEQERQRLVQEKKDALVTEQLRRQDIQQKALGGGLLSVAAVAGLLFWGYRNKQKSNALLAGKNQIIQQSLSEKEVLLKEIHHRVKNNLQVISSLLSLQSRQVQDESVQEAIMEGRNRVKSMAMIHQNLYQTENLTTIDVSNYIDNLTKNLFDSYNIEPDRIQMDANIQPLQLDVDILIPLGLILNELITNSLKYAFPENRAGKIEVSLKEKDQILELRVADNGVGLPKDFDLHQSGSMGYQLISAFVAKLKGKLDIQDTSGANILLSIPQYEMA